MAKKTFYTLVRDVKEDGSKYVAFAKREGFDVPNEFGLDLAVYNAKKSKEDVNDWFVVDCSCGLSCGQGSTKKLAMEDAIERLSKVDMDVYKDSVKKANEKFGVPPGRRVMFL